MATHQIHSDFAHLVDLSADALGTFVLASSDDYFAEKENLLKPGAPEWREGAYTDKGKWMDGWESQRRREPGHDFALIRLGAAGRIHGALIDTTHFKGNAPQEVALECIDAPLAATAQQLLDSTDWYEVLPRQPVRPDFQNVLKSAEPSIRATHVRLRIFPDGGVARLRIYGSVDPEPRTFWRKGSVDLAAVENGGTVVAVSDQFFGPPSNLLLPGRGVNMGDGWETKRRRTPGSDWCVIQLARRGIVDRIELDTHFFKGNAPQATLIECADEAELGFEKLQSMFRETKGWNTLLSKTPLVQHRRHQLEPDRPQAVTHLRVHIFPHGGVNRLRVFGIALDSPAEVEVLNALNALSPDEASQVFLNCCGARAWAETMTALRPFGSLREVFAAAEGVWWKLSPTAWLDAFAAHPRIGSKKKAKIQSSKSGTWSKGEQRRAETASKEVREQLLRRNEEYFKKFGFIFIVFATGKSAEEMLQLLEERLGRSKKAEMETAAIEQMKITRLRLEKYFATELER